MRKIAHGGKRSSGASGVWHLKAAREGVYSFTLRRWPKESGLGIASAAPPMRGVDGDWPEGASLPAASAWLRAGDFEGFLPVPEGAKELTFTANLVAGPVQVQSWWIDNDGKKLAGAYYLTAELIR
jgi:hypothetical protein